jgi:hypothetical protein
VGRGGGESQLPAELDAVPEKYESELLGYDCPPLMRRDHANEPRATVQAAREGPQWLLARMQGAGGAEDEVVVAKTKVPEEEGAEETAEAVADEIAGELGVGTGTKVAEIAEDTALSVLENGGSKDEAIDAAEEAAEVRSCDPTDPWTASAPRVCSV